jgi:hypothetical protein
MFVVADEPSTPLLLAQRFAATAQHAAREPNQPRFVSGANNQSSPVMCQVRHYRRHVFCSRFFP